MKNKIFSWLTLASAVLIPAAWSGKAARAEETVYRLDGFYAQLENWMKLYHDPAYPWNPHDLRGHFSYRRGQAQDLYGSADMAYLLYALNEVEDRTTPEGRREWAAFIQSCQDPETGWFTRRNETLHFKEHATAYAVVALKILGAKPLYPLRAAAQKVASPEATAHFLESTLWTYAWVGSHQGGGVAAALTVTGEGPPGWSDWYFDWLDREVNPQTGLWQRAFWNRFYGRPTKIDNGAAAHYHWIYIYDRRPILFKEQLIDSLLSLQLPSGLWDRKRKKGEYPYCINLDAIFTIHRASLQLRAEGKDYRADDIAAAFKKNLAATVAALNRPGALAELYTDSHDLPGAVHGLAELQRYFAETRGRPSLITPRPLAQVLDFAPWL